MKATIWDILPLLRCPDDKGVLEATNSGLVRCAHCARVFVTLGDRFIDVRPTESFATGGQCKSSYERRFADHYHRIFQQSSARDVTALAWGAKEVVPRAYHLRKQREIKQILAGLPDRIGLSCDVTGGAGELSVPLAQRSRIVVNMDLDMANLNYVLSTTDVETIDNLVCVRGDLFSPPFVSEAFDLLVCTDTLIYGEGIVKTFLRSMVTMLAPGGHAAIDFYNRRHRNPIHKPYMLGFTQRECDRFLDEHRDMTYLYEGFYQEMSGCLRWVIPPTRHIYFLAKSGRP